MSAADLAERKEAAAAAKFERRTGVSVREYALRQLKEAEQVSEVLYHCLCEVADQRDEQANELEKLRVENAVSEKKLAGARDAFFKAAGERDELRAKLQKLQGQYDCACYDRQLLGACRDELETKLEKAEAERDEWQKSDASARARELAAVEYANGLERGTPWRARVAELEPQLKRAEARVKELEARISEAKQILRDDRREMRVMCALDALEKDSKSKGQNNG